MMYGKRRIYSKEGGFNNVDGEKLLKGYRDDGYEEVEFEDFSNDHMEMKF